MGRKLSKQMNMFSAGYACACANIIRTHGESTIATDVFSANFMSLADMKAAGVDESDIEVLKPIVEERERRRKFELLK